MNQPLSTIGSVDEMATLWAVEIGELDCILWKPPVTKCGECKTHGDEELGVCFHPSNQSDLEMRVVYLQNERGLTITCPAWQEQNKEFKNG